METRIPHWILRESLLPSPNTRKHCVASVGNVVIVQDQDHPQGLWKIANCKGSNGHIRGTVVRFHSRGNQLILLSLFVRYSYPLEIQTHPTQPGSIKHYWHSTETNFQCKSCQGMARLHQRTNSRLKLWATWLLWLTTCIHWLVSFTLITVFFLVDRCGQRREDVRDSFWAILFIIIWLIMCMNDVVVKRDLWILCPFGV